MCMFLNWKTFPTLRVTGHMHVTLKLGAKCPYNWGSAAKIGLGSCYSMLVVGWGEYHSNYAKDWTAWCFLCLTQNFLIFKAVRGVVLQMPAISAREHVYKQVLCQNHGFRKCHICTVSIFGRFLIEGNLHWYRWCWVGLGKTRKNTPTRSTCPGWLLPTPPGSSNLHQHHHCTAVAKVETRKTQPQVRWQPKVHTRPTLWKFILHISHKSQDNKVYISHWRNM